MFWPYALACQIELKVMEPGAFKFDSLSCCNTSWAKQRWHAEKWLPDHEERGSRILFKEAHESDQCCVAAPRNTTRYTIDATPKATLPNCWQEAAFCSFDAFKE